MLLLFFHALIFLPPSHRKTSAAQGSQAGHAAPSHVCQNHSRSALVGHSPVPSLMLCSQPVVPTPQKQPPYPTSSKVEPASGSGAKRQLLPRGHRTQQVSEAACCRPAKAFLKATANPVCQREEHFGELSLFATENLLALTAKHLFLPHCDAEDSAVVKVSNK